MTAIFWGYPGLPKAAAEVLRSASQKLKSRYESRTWEDLVIDGRVVISQVLTAIDESDFCIFDVTRLNPNVLFEVGYALGKAKPFWLTIDKTIADSTRNWSELAILKEIGYTAYSNSDELVARVTRADAPSETPPLYDQIIEPVLPQSSSRTALFYRSTFAPFEASNRLSTHINDRQRAGLSVILDDPNESSNNPITWYAPKIASAAGVLINFAGQPRTRSKVTNARGAFVAGLAHGLETPLKMLAEDDYERPFDYESIISVYSTAADCVNAAREWLNGLVVESVRITTVTPPSQLAGIRLGEHVAENERFGLADYFVRTAAFEDVLNARDALFVGHRGTGKTANALQAFEQLSGNKENLAILIKPAGFEFPGLVAVVERLPDFTHDYLFDTLWRFIVETEIAAALLARADARPTYVPSSQAEKSLAEYCKSAPFDIRSDISVRLDQALGHLISSVPNSLTPHSGRVLVNEAFHETALARLRHELGIVLREKKRVAVLIDNLDKGWEKNGRLDIMSRLILGLLTAKGRIVADFGKEDRWRERVNLTIALFLRSDIFTYVKKMAREPDKLSTSMIEWRDREVLDSVLQARVAALWPASRKPPALWGGVFADEIAGQPTSSFIHGVLQPRPRDAVYFCNAAIARALDRRHNRVEASDVHAAVEMYSTYAFEALLVENGITVPQMESVLYAFLGSEPVVKRREIIAKFNSDADIPEERYDYVINRLIEMSFLGLEVHGDSFRYPEIGTDLKKAMALAARLQPVAADQRFKIHTAYHSYLEIEVH